MHIDKKDLIKYYNNDMSEFHKDVVLKHLRICVLCRHALATTIIKILKQKGVTVC